MDDICKDLIENIYCHHVNYDRVESSGYSSLNFGLLINSSNQTRSKVGVDWSCSLGKHDKKQTDYAELIVSIKWVQFKSAKCAYFVSASMC